MGAEPSVEQQAILADGFVTEAELRSALDRAADCLDAAGVQSVRVGHPQLEGNLVFAAFFPDNASRDRGAEAVRVCGDRHVSLVDSAYRVQTRGSTWWNPVLGPDGKPLVSAP